MSDGLHIRWRETAPDRGLLSYALTEIDALHTTWPETLQCNIVIERDHVLPGLDASPRFRAHVELDLGRRSPRLRAKASAGDVYGALARAFGDLRGSMPVYEGSASGELETADVAA